MTHGSLNYAAVSAAGLAYFIFGAIWYAKPLFGKIWMQGIRKTEEQVKADFKMVKLFYVAICSVIASYGMARILSWIAPASLGQALMVAFLTGVCFVIMTFLINDIMESRPFKLTIVNVLYHLFGFLLIGLILGLWK